MAPGDARTLAAGAQPTAANGSAPPPRLRRQGVSDTGASKDNTPWVVQLEARLTRPALAGNAIVSIADAADVEAGYVAAMRQAKVPGGSAFAARFSLSPIDGVLPGRLYHIRVVQLVKRAEVLLAEGDVRLE